jgi:hypothetical protein
MTDLRRVSGPSSRFDRQAGRIIVIAVVAIVIAIVKPWGTSVRPSAFPATSPRPTASPSPPAAVRPPMYDFLTFGTNEPQPAWELWPAGNLASFYFAMRIDMEAKAAEAPEDSSAPTPIPIATASSVPGPGGVPKSWPTIHIPVGSDLDLLGLNRPIGYDIEIAALVRLADDGTERPVEFRIGRSSWPEHFTTVGFPAAGSAEGMEPWPPGHYRLDVVIDPGRVARSVEIIIDTPRPTPSASASASASVPASPVP